METTTNKTNDLNEDFITWMITCAEEETADVPVVDEEEIPF